jgi:hypothetical protein
MSFVPGSPCRPLPVNGEAVDDPDTEEEDDLDQELPAPSPPANRRINGVEAGGKRKRARRSRARFWHPCEGGLGSLVDLMWM